MTNKKEEYDFYKSIGICVRCHKRAAEPNKVMCMECSDKEAEYGKNKRMRNNGKQRDLDKYYRLKETGICTYCKHEKAVMGKTKCKKCLAKIRSKRNARKQDLDRSERISYGICYICGNNPVLEGKGVCENCYKTRVNSIEKCIQNRKKDFNNYWKGENNLVFKAGANL